MSAQALSAGRIGCLNLKNRMIMGSMHIGLEEAKTLEDLAEFYRLRAMNDVALIITGGLGVNRAGALYDGAETLDHDQSIKRHKVVTQAVHGEGGLICAQLLHAGRYAMHKNAVAPSSIKAPISPFTPKVMSAEEIIQTIDDYAQAALRAEKAGYDGIEIMGSEGYLINQFLAKRTNQRDDEWGGDFPRRMRFALEVVRGVRAVVSPSFCVIFRISLLDLVSDGSDFDEVIRLAQELEALGVDALNSGFGWHEARIPTIAGSVPAMPFLDYTARLKSHIKRPIIAANRFFEPDQVEYAIANQLADFVSLARPFLADPQFARKFSQPQAIIPCIGCNQACLDHIFMGKRASCLVNPKSGFEREYAVIPTLNPQNFAIIGAGPAGLSAAQTLHERGHKVRIFEKSGEIGGQLRLAAKIPGKEDFHRLIEYYENWLIQENIPVKFTSPEIDELRSFDGVIIATGVRPRTLSIKGADQAYLYDEALRNRPDGERIAIIGSGPIGFDVASFFLEDSGQSLNSWRAEWNIPNASSDTHSTPHRGEARSQKILAMFQRKANRFGRSLGKTTGWIHKARLDKKGAQMIGNVEYIAIDQGVHYAVDGHKEFFPADQVILAIGQESEAALYDECVQAHLTVHKIGGALNAEKIDAKRAIYEGFQLARAL